MNIFYLHQNQTICAEYHTNKHVISQLKESCQLLSTAHRILDGEIYISVRNGRKYTQYILPDSRNDALLKFTHPGHPCAQWARDSSSNYAWLINLTVALCKEYTHRYGKIHKYEREGLVEFLKQLPTNIQYGPMTPFAQAMPEQYRNNDAVIAYRNYYIGEKSEMLQYKNRDIPEWIPTEILTQQAEIYDN